MNTLSIFKWHILHSLALCIIFAACTAPDNYTVTSPNGKLTVEVAIKDSNKVYYTISKEGKVILEPSLLGIQREDADFTQNLSVISVSAVQTVNDTYTLKSHKKDTFVYQANEKIYALTNNQGEAMEITFQVSDNGVAFRYHFPAASEEVKHITDEGTSFAFNADAKAWLQPAAIAKSGWGECNPSYEEHYLQNIPVGTPSPLAGWVFPALFKTNGTWVLISESDVKGNYCGSRLAVESPNGVYKIDFPDEREVIFNGELYPQSTLPWTTPWRTIAIGTLGDIFESSLVTDVATPAIDGDFSWVKPGRASWSWVLLKDDLVVYPIQKKFIDYSAIMGWEYCLIDNYWDTKIGYEKIKELSEYAASKNVKLILWYNSAGDWNTTPQTPQNMMLTEEGRMAEFKKIKDMGIAGVKVDFFGGDGQSVMAYYHDILKSAAKAGIMVNFHGCTLPRGWQRTYPNLMTMESVKGMEFTTFTQEDQDPVANHATVLPFTRNVYESMDFTPTCFGEIPNINRVTTNGFEIALPIIFYSGIQHFAEVPEVMDQQPDFVKEFMSNVPATWDDSRFLDGYPGKFVVIARKAGDTWYIAGINGQNESYEVNINLSFTGKTQGKLITDEGTKTRTLNEKRVSLENSKELTITMNPRGGFVITL